MATLVRPVHPAPAPGLIEGSDQHVERRWRPLYRAGGWAAVGVIALIVVNAVVLTFYPIPATVLGHFEQIQENKLVGLINLDLVMLVSQLLLVVVAFALLAVLRKVGGIAVIVATGISLVSAALYLAVNPTFTFLYLSDQYAGAATAARRAALLAAGEASWANYQGTAFAIAYILAGVATLIFARVMLKSQVFSRWTAYVGFVLGATALIPPLPAFGTPGVVVSFLSLVPLVVFETLVAWGLFKLGSTRTPLPKA